MSNISEICNNPLNIKFTGDSWRGLVGEYKGFARFVSDRWGYRAAVKILLGYIAEGLWTPKMIIMKWAPPPDNDVDAYCRVIERASQGKFTRDRELFSWNDLAYLIKYMTLVERGVIGDEDVIQSGIRLALPDLSEKQKLGYNHFGLYCSTRVVSALDRFLESSESLTVNGKV